MRARKIENRMGFFSINTYQSCSFRPLLDISPNMICQIYFWNLHIWIRGPNDELFIFRCDFGVFVFPINWASAKISMESCEIKLSYFSKLYFLEAGNNNDKLYLSLSATYEDILQKKYISNLKSIIHFLMKKSMVEVRLLVGSSVTVPFWKAGMCSTKLQLTCK